MKKIELPHIGELSLREKPFTYKYEANLWNFEHDGWCFDLGIRFMELAEEEVEWVSQVMLGLDRIREQAIAACKKEYQDGQLVKEYLEGWAMNFFDPKVLNELVADTDPDLTMEERLLNVLDVNTVVIFAGTQPFLGKMYQSIAADVGLGRDIGMGFLDRVISIFLDKNYQLKELRVEDNSPPA